MDRNLQFQFMRILADQIISGPRSFAFGNTEYWYSSDRVLGYKRFGHGWHTFGIVFLSDTYWYETDCIELQTRAVTGVAYEYFTKALENYKAERILLSL